MILIICFLKKYTTYSINRCISVEKEWLFPIRKSHKRIFKEDILQFREGRLLNIISFKISFWCGKINHRLNNFCICGNEMSVIATYTNELFKLMFCFRNRKGSNFNYICINLCDQSLFNMEAKKIVTCFVEWTFARWQGNFCFASTLKIVSSLERISLKEFVSRTMSSWYAWMPGRWTSSRMDSTKDLKVLAAVLSPKTRRLLLYAPKGVVKSTIFYNSVGRSICQYALVKANAVKYLQFDSLDIVSLILGRG